MKKKLVEMKKTEKIYKAKTIPLFAEGNSKNKIIFKETIN
jgi:hypothetical protein